MEKDIAIIGMACRVAGANSPMELWENLLSARDVQRRITRFNIDGFYHPDGGPLKGLTNVDRAYMLDDAAVDKFDNAFFHTTPAEAPAMDPQQRMLLEVSFEAIENAGITLDAFTGTGTAVFTGTSSPGSRRRWGIEGSDYHTVLARDPDVTPKYIVTGTAGCMAANRLSYFYDLSGPSISVDTACSSSMAALHQAARTLQHGDCPMALVCGTNLIFNPESFGSMSELGFLSASGRCRSFDAAGDGYGRGEGIACLVLKPLKKAIDDNDPIRAVIKGTRLNQDGRTQGITLPSTRAQIQNMSTLYQELAIDPSTVQYFEAHGTGTAAGDPLELQAVNVVYEACPLVVGSVKSNIGHCEAASALIGLIKTVLSLENAQIPAQMCFDTPNPAIDFTNLTIPTKTLPWPDTAGHIRRAAINTFGAGGTNGHAVLEAYNRPSNKSFVGQRPWLFKLSAADPLSLQALKKAYAAYLEHHTPNLRDLAHTLVARRSDFRHSQFFVASSHDSLRTQLLSNKVDMLIKSGDPVKEIIFVFTGQGAQWAQMGCGLMNLSPLLRSILQTCEDILRELPDGPSWSIIDELSKEFDRSDINDARFSQPLCTALQVGIVSLLRSWGIRPNAVVGHSSGEIAAAFAAGMISLRSAIITAYYRGLVLASSDLTNSRGAIEGQWKHDHGAVLRDIPSYQWNHSNTFWSESRVSRKWRFRAFPRHELLGSRYQDDISPCASWRNHLDPSSVQWLAEIHSGDLPGLSPSICLLMALEAARQMCVARDVSTSAIRITSMKFFDSILCVSSPKHQRLVETHFISRADEVSSQMSFEIFRTDLAETDKCVLCCSGDIELNSQASREDHKCALGIQEDRFLLQKAQFLYPSIFKHIEEIQMSNRTMSGRPFQQLPGTQNYPIHPMVLGSILSLGPAAILESNLPSTYRLRSISNFQLHCQSQSSTGPYFNISTESIQAGGVQSKLSVSHNDGRLLTGYVQYSTIGLIPPSPVTTSLFYRPVLLPDVTKHFEAESVSIEDLVLLTTHKWSMIDVKIGNVPNEAKNRILEILGARDLGRRSGVRSIQLYGVTEATKLNDSLQAVKELTRELPAHMIFAQGLDDPTELLRQSLRGAGLVCVCNLPEARRQEMADYFDHICETTGLGECVWTLWRVKDEVPSFPSKRQKVVFSNRKVHLKGSPFVNLRPMEVQQFANQAHERFDALVVDEPRRSIITSWSGNDLIAWLQYLMKHAESVLWVSLDVSSGPFAEVAGTLLRTLQAEQPSLKVSWLLLNDADMGEELLMGRIENAYESIQRGDNEVQLEINRTSTHIIRYVPDEALSTAVGVSIPRKVLTPIGGRDYALSVAAPREPVVLSYEPDSAATAPSFKTIQDTQVRLTSSVDVNKGQILKMEADRVKVLVKASLIDVDDLRAYDGHLNIATASDNSVSGTSPPLGKFFAGVVLTSTNPSFEANSPVVGWTHGAHVNVLNIPSQYLYQALHTNHARTVATFAAYATIMAALDGNIRAKKDDHVEFLNKERWIYEAFVRVSMRLGIVRSECKTSCSRTFTIRLSRDQGLLVDEKTVDVLSYLASSPTVFREFWNHHHKIHLLSEYCFDFKNHPAAFERVPRSGRPTVLIHGDVDSMTHAPIYRQPADPILRSGTHVIIGGLGGLGRYVCSWLVDRGAESLYAISRSGISSSEAQQLYDKLNLIPGVIFQVIKADACDRTSMSSILSDIRSKHSIIGVINMAMVLGDAPMAGMTGEEWDRALRVKIDSSWILHELTLDDQLDYFILFSSIASVLGNRNQGSYNVGNTFLNALATYRRRLGKTGVAIALGAMTDIGVLTTLKDPSTYNNLTRSGLTHLTTSHFSKILEAAIYKSRQQRLGRETLPEEAVMVTGLEMFEKDAEGRLVGRKEALYWTELPEFGHLGRYRSPFVDNKNEGKKETLKERIGHLLKTSRDGANAMGELKKEITTAFLDFLSGLLGFNPEAFDLGNTLGIYGLDSLNAGVFESKDADDVCGGLEVGVDVSVREIFQAKSIRELVGLVCERVGGMAERMEADGTEGKKGKGGGDGV
ncbi:MAG: hypothetical protein Q9179_002982 [Wetmoreana sp. 5 TL-2023]